MAEEKASIKLGRRERESRARRLEREKRAAIDSASAISAYMAGASLKASGQAVGRSEFFAWNAVKKAGIPFRAAGNPDILRPYRRKGCDVIDEVIARYISGESAKSISKTGKISKPSILKELRKRGIEVRTQIQGDPSEITSAYLRGLSTIQTAALCGCTKKRVSIVLKEAGISLRKRRVGVCLKNSRRINRERYIIITRATPKWVDKEALRAVYAEAARLSLQTGILHDVDHIVPLKNKLVSGLHVPRNLRPLPKAENSRKRNRFTGIETRVS